MPRLACVACHPDDESLSLGSLLLRARQRETEITMIWATRGQSSRSEDASARTEEALEVIRRLEANCVWLDLPDGSLTLPQVLPTVEAQLRSLQPSIVVWPYGNGAEHHQDHRVLHESMLNISKRAPYDSTCWIVGQPPVYDDPTFKPNLFLGMSEEMLEQTKKLMGFYRSELNKRFAKPSFLENRAARWAHEGQTATRYAEPYCLIKGVPPMDLFRTHVISFSAPDANGSVLDFLHSLERDNEALVFALLERLIVEGLDIPEYSYIISGQIRTLFTYVADGRCLHLLYFARPDGQFIVLHGLFSPSQSVSDTDISIAKARMTQWGIHSSQAQKLVDITTLPRPPRPANIKTPEGKFREGK